MKYLKNIVAASALSLFAVAAQATVIEQFIDTGASYDISTPGDINFSHTFDTSLGTAVSATLEVQVLDIDYTTYMYVLDTATNTWSSIGTLTTGNGVWRTSLFNIPAASLDLLNTDGMLSFRFNDSQSSYWWAEMDWSKLTVTYDPANSQVPEPATALLMGLGLIGFGAARRKAGRA